MDTDDLYIDYARLMADSCHTGEDEEEGEEEDGDAAKSFEVKTSHRF